MNHIVYQNVDLHAEGVLKLHERLRLLAGMRLDRDERYDETPLSPRVALIASPMRDLALKAIYTEAFVQPAAYAMYDVYNAGLWTNTTNPERKPERARSFELNAVFRRDDLMVSVSGYYKTQRDILLTGSSYSDSIMVNPTVFPAPVRRYATVAAGAAYIGGTFCGIFGLRFRNSHS